jgi:photosystem II stability/assembly factor-like uncharacterized protein
MSVGIGTQFTATLSPGQTQTWFTYGWDPNYLVIWSIRPTTQSAQVRLTQVFIDYGELGLTYNLTITNSGSTQASFEGKYYYKTIIREGDWRNLGPDHLSGCMIQVAIDPNTSDRVYGVAQGGGLWKLDSVQNYPATSWIPLTDSQASLVGFAVAIAPSNSSILYLAAGSQLLRSTDGGSTWAPATATVLWSGDNPWGHAVRRIVIDAGNPNRVLVASNTGLWQTTGGAWTALITGDITDVALDPGNSSIVYVAQRNVGVLKSSTGAAPWTTILPWNRVTNPANTMVKVALGNQGTPATRTVAVKFDQQVFVSNNAGGTWTQSALPPDMWGEQQGDWNNVLAVDPFDNRVILAGTQELFRSADGGMTWATVAYYYHPHEDQQSLAFDTRNRGVCYVSNDGGIFRSTDGGQTWMSGASWPWADVFSKQDLNFGLVTSDFYRVGISPGAVVGPIAVGPAHHQGLIASQCVKSREWVGIEGHAWEGANTYSFPNLPGVFFLVQGPDLFRRSYPPASPDDLTRILPGIGSQALAMDNRPGSTVLFAGMGAGTLQYTLNPSATTPTWNSVPGLNLGEPIVSIVFAPGTPGMAYAVSQSGRVFRNNSVATPANWSDMHSNWRGGNVVQLAVNAARNNELYLITNNQIAKSTDGGATWTAIAGGTATVLHTNNFQAILADPVSANAVFVAGDPGVFVSTDAGATWTNFGGGLPNASVAWLQWYGSDLYASLWGRGLWKRQPFANYAEDNVNINTQFTATLGAGQSSSWFTWGWPQNWFVVWSVRPLTNAAQVRLNSVDVQLGPPGFTYTLSITNTGSQPATFEARYGFVTF